MYVHLDHYATLPFAPQFHHLLKDEDGSWFDNYLEFYLGVI